MGPKKEAKKDAQKRDRSIVEEPLNTDLWRCVVVMAVERSSSDSFVLEEFIKEYVNGRRQKIDLIDFDTFLKRILNQFASGDLSYKYAFLLNFSAVLQEACEYVTKQIEIPVHLLAKVIKILLFYLREESLIRLEKEAAGPPDPIAAMAERPANFGAVDTKKKEQTKKADNGAKVRPQSITKADTRLLKRGEPVKDEQRIEDAPLNAYFNLYVLLTGFHHPDLPLELIKQGVPLHGLLCIDTSVSAFKQEQTNTSNKLQKRDSETRSVEIHSFWNAFLKTLWDPNTSPHFKDTIFQVYTPRSLRCDKKKLREFIYREISYLMYDLSDIKGQLDNYLDHMKLRDVEEKESEGNLFFSVPENIPNECTTATLVLQFMIDSVSWEDVKCRSNLSSDSINWTVDEEESFGTKSPSMSLKAWCRPSVMQPNWSQILSARRDRELLKVYAKIKKLDAKYDIDNKEFNSSGSEKGHNDMGSVDSCDFQLKACGENMQEALDAGGVLRSYWKKHDAHLEPAFALDYCLYPLLMSRVLCPYKTVVRPPLTASNHSLKKNNFQLIDNIASQMRKPHFTVTDSSRSILKALPYNLKETSRDFFSPTEFKIVSPEKLKASSAPQFRVMPHLKVQTSFTSETISRDISQNPFENLGDFLNQRLFDNVNRFCFLELLGKDQLLERKTKHWNSYNCIDHTHSLLNDCIFIALHNRTDGQNVHYETFNKALRTRVGLRDFYDYVLEDESEWFARRDPSRAVEVQQGKFTENHLPSNFSDSDFWLVNSIKYQEGIGGRGDEEAGKEKGGRGENRVRGVETGGDGGGGGGGAGAGSGDQSRYDFEGYNVSDMVVQFSGLKTVYYSNDCSMTVELIERLYGNQDLGIHVTAADHTLHLYSYVCPEPHVLEPFTFHVTYANGVIVAFGRRYQETFEEVEEIIESKTAVKGKKNSSDLPTRVVKRLVPKTVPDEEFFYDLAASLPNGLLIRILRREVKPCYIKQRYLDSTDAITRLENSRLFLPNGNVVRMLTDGTVVILKPDTSIVTAALDDLTRGDEGFHFTSFHAVSSEGYATTFEDGKPSSSNRYQVLQNTDVDANQQFFRRRDGTNYLLQSDGTLCVEFKDGTKISSSVFVKEEPGRGSSSKATPGEDDFELDFQFVCTRVVMEHPAYATAVYDSHAQRWTLLLPHDSTISVESDGQYFVDVDDHTEVKVEAGAIQMNKYSAERRLTCATTADLSVFDNGVGGVYCHMENLKGKFFIVEANSNCYILDGERASEGSDEQEPSAGVSSQESEGSEFVASADLQTPPSSPTENGSELSRSNRYFVIKRDLTGFELLHEEDVKEVLSEKKKGSLVFTGTLPGTNNRVFVLLTPKKNKTLNKWQVGTVLPNPKYVPNASKKQASSTYGSPPSWMHPFPKRRNKFEAPQRLSSRVFIETTPTDLSPPPGELECEFCDLEEASHVYSRITPGEIEEYLKNLANDEQDILKEMYTAVAESLINSKKKFKPINTEKLGHYLTLSRYYVEMQEYHKHCIRYNIVPNYFHHPAGISWLILSQLIEKLKIFQLEFEGQGGTAEGAESGRKSGASYKADSVFSYEEIEYNLSQREVLSFSDLSYRSDVSAQTAPAILRTGGVCRCKVSSTKDVASAPAVKYHWKNDDSLADIHEFHQRVCDFHENDFAMLGREERQVLPMTLEDLKCLGLV